VTLDGAFTGAVNSGQTDSIWTAAGVSAGHAAFSGAPAYYEVGLPTGAYAGQAPRGIMLVIHGGAWMKTGIGAVQSMRPDANRWRARGWETVNLTYRACGQTATDVLWFYDKATHSVRRREDMRTGHIRRR
jgi:acetyl esterase/lipase